MIVFFPARQGLCRLSCTKTVEGKYDDIVVPGKKILSFRRRFRKGTSYNRAKAEPKPKRAKTRLVLSHIAAVQPLNLEINQHGKPTAI